MEDLSNTIPPSETPLIVTFCTNSTFNIAFNISSVRFRLLKTPLFQSSKRMLVLGLP